jgi:hypothetical protein
LGDLLSTQRTTRDDERAQTRGRVSVAERLVAWTRRRVSAHPWLEGLAPWAVSIGSLTLGLATLFVFRRGLPHVSWVVGYLLLLWFLLTLLAELRAPLEKRGRHLVVGAGEYLVQTLCHGLLLFVLPSYYFAATLTSPNAVLVGLLAVGALLTSVDPWYRALVHPRPWLRCVLLGLAMFGGLNVALALVGMRPIVAAVGAAGLTGVALTPALTRPGQGHSVSTIVRAAGLAAGAMAVVWIDPVWVPPAPLFVARAAVARDVVNLEPVDVIDGVVNGATILRWGSLAAYTAIYAPAGVRQSIEHVWRRDGIRVARIPLVAPVMGGRREGFRTFSRRREWHPPIAGHYRVDVVTTSGQLVGRVAFTVTP